MKYSLLIAAALAVASGATTATTVEFTVDVTAKTKATTTNGVPTFDSGFKPTTFSMTFQFDLENASQQLLLIPNYHPMAMTIMDGSATSSSTTPFTQALTVAPPANAYVQKPFTQIAINRTLSGWHDNPDQVMPTTDSVNFSSSQTWTAPVEGDLVTSYSYWRGIELFQNIAQLSRNQLTIVSGQDFLSFLQTQVGLTFANAFYEGSGISTGPYGSAYPDTTETGIRGDFTVRSVSVVPEPGTWLMFALGLTTLWAFRRHRT